MKTLPLLFAGALLVALGSGCSSTPDKRISKNPEVFQEWPVAIQEKVRSGQVDLGFTPEQVKMALGAPDRTFTRTNNDGTTEIWAYRDRGPRFSFGVGLGFGGGNTAVGTGISTTTGYREDEKLHVLFTGGRVSAIETTKIQ